MPLDYMQLLNDKLSLFTYLFLSFSILSLWIKREPLVWGSLFLIAILFGFIADRIHWQALIFIIFFLGFTYLSFHAFNTKIKILCGIIVTLLSAMLLLHLIPGFSNWIIVKNLIISPNAISHTLYLNFDKPIAGLFILGVGTLPLLNKRFAILPILKNTFPLTIMGILIICGLSYALGYIKFDLKFTNLFLIWALNNFILVCITEEVLFRGFIQRHLSVGLRKYRFGDYIALLFASLLFGLVHVGSLIYMLLAGVAGLLYGLVYQKTKCIEASIFTHFLLNTIHFIAFTYPALALKV